MTKKILSVILAMLMVFSASAFSFISVSAEAMDETSALTPTVSDSLKQLPEVKEGCNRYFFLMPDDWNNEYSDGAGIYWWEGTDAQSSWPGVKANKADCDSVYYYDVPKDVVNIMWNNYVDLTLEEYNDAHWADLSTGHKELEDMPVNLSECDGKIYVIDPERTETNPFSGKKTFYGDWFYYYGEGNYGAEELIATPDTLPAVAEGYNRYYFLMPDEWYNEYTDTAGIYWWEGSETPDEWPGYIAHKADADNVYYYDVPKDVETIIWNNNVDCGTDKEAPIYKAAFQTYNITANYYEPLESDTYPQGIPTFDGMIFVTNGYLNAGYYNGRLIYDGEWYYYYGNGEYGLTPGKDDESYMVGDTDSDGVVTVRDATAIQKKIADIPVSNYSELSGDADLNGIVNIKDATEIQKYVARLISVNPFVGATLVIE